MRQIVKVFKALSDPTRLRILYLLYHQELCVCELIFILKMEQSRISHQLRILRDLDLVVDEREGKRSIYKLHPQNENLVKTLLIEAFKDTINRDPTFQTDLNTLELCRKKQIRPR